MSLDGIEEKRTEEQIAMKKRESEKRVYEAPEAMVVHVQLEERVLGCLYSTIRLCGLTE